MWVGRVLCCVLQEHRTKAWCFEEHLLALLRFLGVGEFIHLLIYDFDSA